MVTKSEPPLTSDAQAHDEEGHEDESSSDLLKSAYQVAREANIKRNLEELRALGLIDEEKDERKVEVKVAEKTKQTKTHELKRQRLEIEPSRRSKRIQKMEPDGTLMVQKVAKIRESLRVDEVVSDKLKRVSMERKIARLKELHEKNHTGYKNPTATYEHTWMRVRTMSDKQLQRRISVIEKACGEHCMVKMRMFSEILVLAGKRDLAKEAEGALLRLQNLVTAA